MRSGEDLPPTARTPAARFPLALLLLLLVALVGCGAEDGSTPDRRGDWPIEVTARIDSGNAAYRSEDYPEARRQFRAAVAVAPEMGTAWFGVYMAESALGNTAAADSALARVGELGDAARIHHVAPEGEPDRNPSARHEESGGGGSR